MQDSTQNPVSSENEEANGSSSVETETTVEATVESPVEATVEAPAEALVEATVEATAEAPVEALVEATAEATVEATVEATAAPKVSHYCVKCGTAILEGQAFCSGCGSPANASVAPSPAPQKKKSKVGLIIGLIALVLVIIIGSAVGILAATGVLEDMFSASSRDDDDDDDDDISIDGITATTDSITLRPDEQFHASCLIFPSNADPKVRWKSSDKSVATVDDGLITAVGEGTCTITVSAAGKSDTIEVTVTIGPDFKEIYNSLSSTYGFEVGSDNSYLSIDTNPANLDDYTNFSIASQVSLINERLGCPESLYQEMLQTNSLMGKQTETFESLGITVSWTYHPDKGLEVTYKLINK